MRPAQSRAEVNGSMTLHPNERPRGVAGRRRRLTRPGTRRRVRGAGRADSRRPRAMTDTPSAPPGWYPDPNDPGRLWWWDGTAWTEHTQAAGAPPSAPSAPAPPPSGEQWGAPPPSGDQWGAPAPPAGPWAGSAARPPRGGPGAAPWGGPGGPPPASGGGNRTPLIIALVVIAVVVLGLVPFLLLSGDDDDDDTDTARSTATTTGQTDDTSAG